MEGNCRNINAIRDTKRKRLEGSTKRLNVLKVKVIIPLEIEILPRGPWEGVFVFAMQLDSRRGIRCSQHFNSQQRKSRGLPTVFLYSRSLDHYLPLLFRAKLLKDSRTGLWSFAFVSRLSCNSLPASFRIDRSVTGASIGDNELESSVDTNGRKKWIFIVGKIISSFILLILPFLVNNRFLPSRDVMCISEIDFEENNSLFEKLFRAYECFRAHIARNSHHGRNILRNIFTLEIKSILDRDN